MDKIAATAGVSKRTVYNHFPSKEELFAEILNQLWARVTAEQEAAYRPDLPLRDQLRLMLQAKLQMLADDNFSRPGAGGDCRHHPFSRACAKHGRPNE